MKIEFKGTACIVEREENDPKYYGVVNAAGESRLLHAIKKQLNSQGYDLIKKRMHKDGHLVADMQQYLRTRSSKSLQPHVVIYNPRWQVQGAEVDFNAGKVVLSVERDIFIG